LFVVTCGRGERGLERRRGDARRRAGLPPSPGHGVGLGPPCRQSGSAYPRKVRNAVFGKGICANKLRSEALPCLKEDKTASEERLGRAKAKPPHTPIPEATLSRGSPFCRMLITPAVLRTGWNRMADSTRFRPSLARESCAMWQSARSSEGKTVCTNMPLPGSG
jgi:hypothetical protein